MRQFHKEELILSGVALSLAGVSPNIFPAAQAGLAPMHVLGLKLLLPSAMGLVVVVGIAKWRRHRRLSNRIFAGAVAGVVGTLGLEAVRATSFHVFEGMPGDLPRLLGVLLTDRFMLGPSLLSDAVGWIYHFWNGAMFGIIFAVLFGRRSMLCAIIFGEAIGVGFLLSPAVSALGVGFMGLEMPSMPITIAVAHLAYGFVLGILCRRWIRHGGWLLRATPVIKPRRVATTDSLSESASQPSQCSATASVLRTTPHSTQ